MSEAMKQGCLAIDISEADVIAAMKEIQGYIDISPGDFKEVFQVAYAHALLRIRNSLKAEHIMTRAVRCVGDDMDLLQTAAFLANKNYSGAPVVDADGKVVGVISEKDFLTRMGMGKSATFMQIIAHCLNNRGCLGTPLRNHCVGEIMTTPAVTARPDITVGAIAALFSQRQINRLPIVDADNRPIGIVTRTDLVQSCCLTDERQSI